MTMFTEAHFNGIPQPSVLVDPSLSNTGGEAYLTMETILKNRWKIMYPEKTIGAAVVFMCHEGTPDPSLRLTEEEQSLYFPTPSRGSVRILGSH